MAIIKPFKAVRPAKNKVAHVVSKSYQSYSRPELKAQLSYNPFSFLHIIKPSYNHPKNTLGKEQFELVHNGYLKFIEEGILVKDVTKNLYLYQVESETYSSCGLFCSASVEDYRNNIIKKHEDTLQRREALFANYLNIVKFNAEPVLMTYTDNNEIDRIIAKEKGRNPEYHFADADNVTHSLWVISDTKLIVRLQKAFTSINALYIADGHHRSASSDLLAKKLKENNSNHTGKEPYNFFMSCLIPESQIHIFEFNRMVKNLNGQTKDQFLVKLDAVFRIIDRGNITYKPSKKNHFGMYLDGSFYSLYLRKKEYKFTDALSVLDTQILYLTVLRPILGIIDLRKDKRIRYVYGRHSEIIMKNEIDKGIFTVGFSLVPITISEMKAIADADLVMPPKSTYIQPKLLNGLAIYEF